MPRIPVVPRNATDVDVDESVSCAVWGGGRVTCWGENAETAPVDLVDAVQVAVGTNHACARRSNGALRCWGDDAFGETQPPAGTYVDVSANFRTTCAVTTTGDVRCFGVLGLPENQPELPPTSICEQQREGMNAVFDCGPDRTISGFTFASYGNPVGWCGMTNALGTCHAPQSLAIAQAACVGQRRCEIPVSSTTFSTTCPGGGGPLPEQSTFLGIANCD